MDQEIPFMFNQPFFSYIDVKEGNFESWEKKFLSILKSTPCPVHKWCEYINQVSRKVALKRKKGYKMLQLFPIQSCLGVEGNLNVMPE